MPGIHKIRGSPIITQMTADGPALCACARVWISGVSFTTLTRPWFGVGRRLVPLLITY